MSNLSVINNDLASVILANAQFKNELLTFGGVGTELKGTLLGRQAVDVAITVTPDGGNVGDGTTAASVVGVEELPVPGNYNLECTFVVAEGGVFKFVDPNGNIVADNITLRVGAGLVTTLNIQGLQIVVTEGGTDFSVGDKFQIAVVANGKLVPFAIGGVAGAGIPIAVMTKDVAAAGAGDEFLRALVAGSVRKEKLIISADGDGSNITDAILDQLRNYSIVAIDVEELNIQDNQ